MFITRLSLYFCKSVEMAELWVWTAYVGCPTHGSLGRHIPLVSCVVKDCMDGHGSLTFSIHLF